MDKKVIPLPTSNIWCHTHSEYAAICAGCLNEVLFEDPKDVEIRQLKLKVLQLEQALKDECRRKALAEIET